TVPSTAVDRPPSCDSVSAGSESFVGVMLAVRFALLGSRSPRLGSRTVRRRSRALSESDGSDAAGSDFSADDFFCGGTPSFCDGSGGGPAPSDRVPDGRASGLSGGGPTAGLAEYDTRDLMI